MATILIIEDNEEIRSNIAEMLSLSGYQVQTATNGKEGLASIANQKPDLIICDIMMPVIDGFGVIHILRKQPDTSHIPLIFLTAKTEHADFRQAMGLGADDFITKPFSGSELLSAIEVRLQRQQQLYPAASAVSTDTDYLSQLLRDAECIEYKKKQLIYKEGSTARFLYYLNKGMVKAYKQHEDGKELTVNLYGEGDYLGYTELLQGIAHHETAEAMDDAELLLVPRKAFDTMIHQHPAAIKIFADLMAFSLQVKETEIIGMAYNTLRQKVAAALLHLHTKYHKVSSEPFSIAMSRDELASIAGTATESLIRTLSEFRQEEIIGLSNGKITILNHQKLEHVLR